MLQYITLQQLLMLLTSNYRGEKEMAELQTEDLTVVRRKESSKKRRLRLAFINFFMLWLLLIAGGFYATHSYMEHFKKTVTGQIEEQTSAQIKTLQTSYDEQIEKLETSYITQLSDLQIKIEQLNELLTFTKDNANSSTDNSNMLYTQLNAMKTQLNELQKSLELMK